MSRVSTLLVLGASVSQLPAIRRAREAGHRVVAVDADSTAVGLGAADVAVVLDFSDVERVVETAGRHRVDGVLAVSTDRAVPVAAAVAERLRLPGIGTEVARAMTDKAAMRVRLAAAGLPQPPFAVVAAPAEAEAAFAAVGAPAVLKPVDSGGQRGLARVATAAALAAALPRALAHSRSHRAILEREVEGAELNGIVVVRGGEPTLVLLSDRLRPHGRGFGVGWIHLFPSSLPAAALARAGEVAVEAVRALGLRDGIGFPQLLVDGGGRAWVVEVAARIPAGQMRDVVRLGVGVELLDVAFRQALGEPVPDELVRPRFARPLACRFLTARPGPLPVGRVVGVGGLERVRASPGVLEAGLYLQPGETIRPVRVDADRRGYVIATGPDPARALAAADAAAQQLVVVTERASSAASAQPRPRQEPLRPPPAPAA